MEPLDSLVAALSGERDLVGFVAALLRFCRDRERELRAADDDATCAAASVRVRQEADILFREVTGRYPSSDTLERVIQVVRNGASSCGPELAARAVAGAFDDSLGPRVFDWFRACGGTITLREGDPFPVVQHPVKRIFGKRLNSRPERHSTHASALSYLRIAPRLDPFDVVLSFQHADLIRALDRGDRVGVGIPWASADEYEHDRSGSPDKPRFFNVRPRNSAGQQSVLTQLLDAAEAASLSLLVLPELCVDVNGHEVIEKWSQTGNRKVSLLSAGSRHLEDAGARRNRATVFVQSAPPLTHDKFTPFVKREGQVEVREDISSSPARITVHYSEGWSLVVLVCKDLLDERVAPLLEQLRVRLVLVPAFSARTGAFRARLGELACGAQAVVVVANTPSSEACDAMLVALPLEHSGLHQVAAPVEGGTVHWVSLDGQE